METLQERRRRSKGRKEAPAARYKTFKKAHLQPLDNKQPFHSHLATVVSGGTRPRFTAQLTEPKSSVISEFTSPRDSYQKLSLSTETLNSLRPPPRVSPTVEQGRVLGTLRPILTG